MAVSKGNDNKRAGHRERLRKRFLKNGFDGFLEYEILEMVLFYCIPRVDTKDLARSLLAKYKTLSNVFDASVENLKQVDGIGDSAAAFLTMMPKLFKEYEVSKWSKKECLDSTETAGHYAVSLFKDATEKEKFAIICLDSNRSVKWSGIIVEGTADTTQAYPREVMDKAIQHRAVKLILVHNHLNGTLAPSVADKVATEELVKLLKGIGVEVLDHIIVSGSRYFSMSEMGFKFR